MILSYIRSKT